MPLIDLDSYEPPAPEPRGIIRGAADTAVQFGKGAVTGVRMLSDTFGADNAVSGKLRSATEALDGLLSASAQQDQRRIAEIMEEAEGKGWGEQIVAGLKAMGVAPGALIAQGLGTAAPTIAASLIPGVGPAAVASRIGAAGIGAAQGAGSIKGSIYETTKAELLKAGATEAEAEARAVQAQEYAGPNTGQIALGAGLGVLAGTTGAEHAVSALRNGITKTPAGIIGRVLQTGAAEAIPEFAQGGQEKLATNLALANEGFNVDPSSGILANATLEGLAGFGVGAGFGIKAPRENKPPADKPADPAAPLMLGNTPDPIIVFPDGTAGRRADLEAYINNLPEDQRVAARAKLMGMGARDVTPADILSASSADDAIAKFAASITGSDLSASLGQDNPLIAASRDMQAQAAADEADLADLAQSEARDLNTMRAMAAEDARKQQELDALQATGTGQYGIQPEARPAVEAAATVQAPSIMQMAMQRAQQRANPQPAATTVPEVEQRLAAAQQELAAAAPAPIQRQPDILPGDISREDGMPFRTESGAKFKQRYAGGIDGSEIIPVQGGWVVRPKAAPTDPAAAAPGQAAGMQPAASRVPGTVDPAQQGLPALNPSTNGEPADAQAAQAVQSPPQRQEPTARAAPVPASIPDPVQPAEGGAVSTKAQTDQRLIPVSRRGGTPLTPEENRQNSIAADAGELAMQLQNESAEPDFDPKEATQAIKNWAEGRNYTEDELRAAVIADLNRRPQFRRKAGLMSVLSKAPDPRLVPVSQRPASDHVGRNNVPLADGGKPFKTNKAAKDAKKNQPLLRVVRVEGGFALAPKTEAQITAEAKNAKRLAAPRFGNPGVPLAAHEFIAGRGGLRGSERSDMGMEGNTRVGNRFLFASAGGMDMDEATEALKEAGYLKDDASHDDARNLISRSLKTPQYTAEGTEQMAEREQEERRKAFEAEQEAIALAQEAEDNELEIAAAAFEEAMLDMPQGLAQSDMSMEDALLVAGYTQQELENERNQAERAEVDQGPAETPPGNGPQGDRGREGAQGEDQAAGSQSQGLTAPTRADVLRQQAQAEAEAQRKEQGGDKPIERKVTGDTPDMFNTQGSVFDQPAEPEPAPEPAAAPAPSANPDTLRAQADLQNALADLADIFGKNTRATIMPEQEQKLLPVLVKVFDAAFRLGYHKFKDAAKFALDQIRKALGDDAANAITLDHLQGAYISMAGGKTGVDTKRAVIGFESIEEITGTAAPAATEHKVGDLVKLTKPGVNGPINIAGRIERILPDGRLEIRTQQDGIFKVAPSELGHKPTSTQTAPATPADGVTRAAAGGQFGKNGEWYEGGQILPASEFTIKGAQTQPNGPRNDAPTTDTTVEVTPAATIAGSSLVVEQKTSQRGKVYWSVSGDTLTHKDLLDALGFAKPFRMGGKWSRSVFDADPTERLAQALQGNMPAPAPAAEELPSLPADEAAAVLRQNKLEIVAPRGDGQVNDGIWTVAGKGTFDAKDTIKKVGGRWNGQLKAWSFNADPTGTLAYALKERGGPGTAVDDAGPGESDAEIERRRELRQREDARDDERADAGDASKYVAADTQALILRGEKFGIPRVVLNEQIEDIGLIVNAHQKGKPLFLLANEAGTGKTMVLGGAIRELRTRGESKFVYVTMNTDLIAQIKKDLSDYGIDDVDFHTYSELSAKGFDTAGSILIFDEAHNVKNVGMETARANKAQDLIAQAKMTIMASATLFENPVEARYLASTGIFDSVGGFPEWAKMYGASVKVRKFYNPNTGRQQTEEIIYWAGRGKKEDGAAARAWLFKQAIMTQRAMKIEPGMVDVQFRRNAVDAKWVDLYDRVQEVYDAAIEAWTDENGMPRDAKIVSEIARHRENTVKRVLEASKTPFAIKDAQELLAAGRNVVIFVETKADRTLGKWRRSENFKDDTLYSYEQMREMMAEWKMEADAARMQNERAPQRPFAEFIYTLAGYFDAAGLVEELPSTSDQIVDALGADKVGIYTGSVSNAAAGKNKADFLAGRKKVLVATMAKGGTGLSLHDVVGNRPTTQLNINLPWKATGVDQVAARVARYGLRSKTEVRWLFASNIPWESQKLAPRVGARMRDMGAIVKGIEVKAAEVLDGNFDFEGDLDVKGGSSIGQQDEGDIYAKAVRMEKLRRKADDTSGGFFETPFPLAALMTKVSGVRAGHSLLEPSAGRGNLLRLLPDGVSITAVEQREDNHFVVSKRHPDATVQRGDFMEFEGEQYDTILMNPPFERVAGVGAQDVAHVQRAYGMLKDGGRMAAIMGEGAFFRDYKQEQEFREWLDDVGATVIQMPEGAFKQSGTGVRTRMVIIDKNGESGRTDLNLQDMDPASLKAIEALVPSRHAVENAAIAGDGAARYDVNEPGAPYETDIFGNPLPQAQRSAAPARPTSAGVRGNVQPSSGVQDTPAPAGEYFASTLVGSEVSRELGASRITKPEHAAQATAYLYKSAVERLDGIVTDANGKPLGIVGGFKGALAQASVYPATLMAEAVRIPGAARIWFSHNHPSGNPQLSRADENLNQVLTDVFRGSGIEPMGLLAIGDGRFSHVGNSSGGMISNEQIPAPTSRVSVPVIERTLAPNGITGTTISSPAAAKQHARDFYDRAKQPGLMLLNSQNSVIGWVPITDQMRGELRGTGGMNAIYRAISESNAGAAIIVHGGELTYQSIPKQFPQVTPSENIAAALAKIDVRPLDSIEIRPTSTKSTAESGLSIASGPVFARGNPFYSALSAEAAKIPAKAQSGGNWLLNIQGLVKAGKVKQDEVEWSGVGDWLKMQEGKVTREQLVQFLESNGVRVTETVLGTLNTYPGFQDDVDLLERNGFTLERNPGDANVVAFMDEGGDLLSADDMAAFREGDGITQEAVDAAYRVERAELGNATGTKYDNYQLPGGTNYREVLLTLPGNAYRYKGKMRDLSALTPDERNRFKDMSGFAEDGNFADAAELDEWQALFKKTKEAPEGYKSSHWDQPNVLAHIRVNDRVDADGRRVLFVEELQSDWQAAARKQGIGPEPYTIKQITINDLTPDERGGFPNLRGAAEDAPLFEATSSRDGRRLYVSTDRAAVERQAKARGGVGVPDAPFINRTDAWLSLALKRIVKMAVDEGYDRVAFINGDQSAARYDLSKQVKRISWIDDRNRGGRIVTIKPEGGKDIDLRVADDGTVGGINFTDGAGGDFGGKKLSDVIGKDLADKVLATKSGNLSGNGLKVGGEGMKAFYDKIVPNTLKDVLRKVGGGQLETMQIALPGVSMDDEAFTEMVPQPGFTITPAMQERAADGLPLFDRSTGALRAVLQSMTGQGMTVEQVQAIVQPMAAKWDVEVRVVNTPADLPIKAPSDALGLHYNGVIYIVARTNQSKAQVLRTLAHETIAHYGLRSMLGRENWRAFMRQIQFAARRKGGPLQEISDYIRRTYVDENGQFNLSEVQEGDEIAARVVELGVDPSTGEFRPGFGMLKAVFSKVAEFLRGLGFTIKFTNAELQGMLVRSQRAMQEGALRQSGMAGAAAARQGPPSGDIDRAWRDLSGMNKFSDFDSTPETKVTGSMDDFVLHREKGKQWASLNVREARMGDGQVVYTSSLEVGADGFPAGTGAATTMYLQALNIAKQRGMGWRSEGVRSDAAQAIYRKLTEAGVPFEDRDGSSYVSADALAKVDLAEVARTMAQGREAAAFARGGPKKSLVTGQPLPQTWQGPDESRMDDILYSMQDKHIDTKRVVKAVRDSIGTIADNLDPYLQEELYHGRAAMATKEFLEKSIRPLLTDMQARGVEMSDFEEYLHNRHAERRNIQVAKVNPNMPDGGSGIKTADARAYLAGLTPAKRTAYQALAKRVDQMNRDTRALLVSSGLEKQSTIDAWQAAYGDEYVPLMREEMDQGAMGIGQGFSVRGSSSKRAMGSNKPVANILANIALQREKAITRAEKRRIGEALYGMVLSAPNPDFWFAIDPALEQSPAQITATSMQLISMGLNPIDAEAIAREPRQRYIDPRTGQVAERINPVLRSADNVLAVRIDGEDKYVFFNAQDPRAMRMAKSLKNLDSDQLGVVMGNAAKMTRYFSSINTQYNPIFGVVNLVRDIQTALLNLQSTRLAGQQAEVMKHVGSALRGIYIDLRDHRAGKQPKSSWANLFEEFQREGGATGYRDMYANAQDRADAITDELKKLKQGKAISLGRGIMGWLSDYNESMENAVRLATYKVAKESGMSNQQAASVAKNLTVNFNRKGQVALQAGALYAFFNASVQGTARMAETMFEGKKLSSIGKKIITGGLLLGSMQALLLAAAGYDDEEPPDFVRERSLVLPIGGDKYVSIPMPLGFHVIPNLARIPTEWAMGGFRDTPKRLGQLVGLFFDAFNPIGSAGVSLQTITPTIIDPLAALAENKDWTGKPIAKKDFNSMQPTAGHTRAKDTATPWARAIAYGVNIATGGTEYKPGIASPTPDQIDYLIGQATGGVGREASKLSQVGSATVSGEELPLYKIPLIGRFVGTTAGQAAESGRFYENLKQIGEHDAELTGLKKDRRMSEYQQYMRENPEARMVPMAERTYREVSKLMRMKRDAIRDGASQERVRMLDQQITARMRAFNQRVRATEPAT